MVHKTCYNVTSLMTMARTAVSALTLSMHLDVIGYTTPPIENVLGLIR